MTVAALILPVPKQRPELGLTQDLVGAGLLELHRSAVDTSLAVGETPLTDAVVWLCGTTGLDSRWRQRVGLAMVAAAQRVVLCLPSAATPYAVPYAEAQGNEHLTEEQHDAARTWTLVLRRPADQVLVRFIPATTPRDGAARGAARFVTDDDVQQAQRLNTVVRAVVRGELPTDVLAPHVGLDMTRTNSTARVRELEDRAAGLEARIVELQAQIPGTAQYKLRVAREGENVLLMAHALTQDRGEHWAKGRGSKRRRK